MADEAANLDDVGAVATALSNAGFDAVLVGGMALVLLGSRRVTTDFDFVIAYPGERLQDLVDLFYEQGFQLASRLNDQGDIVSTIDNPRVAAIRIRIDGPKSVFFIKRKTRLRIDLLFDFPFPAAALCENAVRTKVRSHVLNVAVEADLLRLKKVAFADRAAPEDAQDIAFLEARLKRA